MSYRLKTYKLVKTIFHHSMITNFGFSSTCHHHPSCSQNLIQQIKEHGTIRGLISGVYKIIRCYSLPI